jgi:hypothetical protein
MATDDDVKKFIQDNFPSYSWTIAIPELFNLFRDAVGSGGTAAISSNQLVSKLEATNWWKSHGSAMRQYMQLQYTDPDTLAEQIRAKDAEVHQIANRMGLSDSQLNIDQMANNALKFGWGAAELQEQLASLAQFNPQDTTNHVGTIDSSMMAIKQNAANYMVNVDDHTAFTWARDVAAGHHVVEDYNSILMDWAKGRFPTLATQIDQGITPSQYFAPIKQEAARLLEKGADTIDLTNDPMFSKIVNYNDPKTNAPRPMNLAEAQSYIRSTDQWKGTKQAQQSASDMTEGILQMFGKTSSGNAQISGPANAF